MIYSLLRKSSSGDEILERDVRDVSSYLFTNKLRHIYTAKIFF